MPRDKDLKRLVRARMTKTGESYTTARAVLAARKTTPVPTATPSTHPIVRDAVPKREWPALAGMSDDAILARTGRTWAEWVAVLDAAGAHTMRHRDIVRHLTSAHDVGSWWCQMVTVGYERIRGLREVGQRRDGGYEANKSRTFALPVGVLYGWVHDARRRKRWLPSGPTRVRGATKDKSVRLEWADGTQVYVYFTAKSADKTIVSVQHTRLASKAEIAEAKVFWTERLDRLGELVR